MKGNKADVRFCTPAFPRPWTVGCLPVLRDPVSKEKEDEQILLEDAVWRLRDRDIHCILIHMLEVEVFYNREARMSQPS